MRVLLAGIFVFATWLGVMGLLETHLGDGPWPWWARPVSVAGLLLALPVALVVFNLRGASWGLSQESVAERIAQLDAEGQLLRQSLQAKRAFEIQEFEDEGQHFFIELADGRVLFLSGQYLYDYEAIVDDPERIRPRTFPCTEFEVLRHARLGYVLEIRCAGQPLTPEVVAPPFSFEGAVPDNFPEDGDIMSDMTFAALKAKYAPDSA